MPLTRKISKIRLPSGRFHNHKQIKIYIEYEVYYALLAKLDTLRVHPEQFFQQAAFDFVTGKSAPIKDQRAYDFWLDLKRKEVDRIVKHAKCEVTLTQKYDRIIDRLQRERQKETRMAKREGLPRKLEQKPKKASQKHLRELFDLHSDA